MVIESKQYVLKIGDRINGIGFAGRDEGVESGEVRARVFVADKEEILAPKSDHSEGSLGAIVIDGNAHVIEEASELGPLVDGVSDRFAERAFGEVFGLLLEE